MKQHAAIFLLSASIAMAWVGGCSEEAEFPDGGAGVGGGGSTANLVGAQGVAITSVAIYQGPKRLLAEAGAPAASNVPLIAGRAALLRIFYTSTNPGVPVTGRLTIAGQPDQVVTTTAVAASTEEFLDSTINIPIDGALIGDTLDYSVAILEEGSDDNPGAHYPASGTEVVAIDGKANTLRVQVVPFRYDADGSGRLPDTSETGLNALRDRLKQLYPVSEVEVTASAPVPWNQTIGGTGQGWQEVGQALFAQKASSGLPADVYHYGMFNPAVSLSQFCGFGCLLGVTLLNDQPSDVGNPQLRLALGVGFTEVVNDTAAHELGHAHGRAHVNCGPGLDPQSIDTSYPHNPMEIGVWSYDILGGGLIAPTTATDIMGYCDNQWISDHNYIALHNRGQNVNAAQWKGEPREHDIYFIDGEGHVTSSMHDSRPQSWGATTPREITHEDGRRETVDGHYFAYDHLEGGWLFVPR